MEKLNNLQSLKDAKEYLGNSYPIYLKSLRLYFENSISLHEFRSRIIHLFGKQKNLHTKVIRDLLKINYKIEKPLKKISLHKYRLDVIRSLGQVERDRLKLYLNKAEPEKLIPQVFSASVSEPCFSENENLFTEENVKLRLLALAEKYGVATGPGCSDFLYRATMVIIINQDVYKRKIDNNIICYLQVSGKQSTSSL
eukprot:NODE_86_length_22075_cov_1.190253.p14 type:complete len:197 gc:universal NODE_86_length_22075_cov_1.190253:11962-12552(+)